MGASRGKPWLIDFDHLRVSVPGDSLGRLFTISYIEKTWSRAVLASVRSQLSELEQQAFRTMALWHLLNYWRQITFLDAPVKGISSLDELGTVFPWAVRQVDASRWTLGALLGDR